MWAYLWHSISTLVPLPKMKNHWCMKCLVMGNYFQDKVDGNGAESIINNNWENRQNFASKIGGLIATWPFSVFE